MKKNKNDSQIQEALITIKDVLVVLNQSSTEAQSSAKVVIGTFDNIIGLCKMLLTVFVPLLVASSTVDIRSFNNTMFFQISMVIVLSSIFAIIILSILRHRSVKNITEFHASNLNALNSIISFYTSRINSINSRITEENQGKE